MPEKRKRRTLTKIQQRGILLTLNISLHLWTRQGQNKEPLVRVEVTETDKSALMWTIDTNKNKRFYDDLQGMGKSKSQVTEQLYLYQELDIKGETYKKKEREINVTPYYNKLW
ncbi:Hypothetical predicted protein [Mytilus galloprovincialis]|uniref:Uncharacterized protein n=1 Tax=Mytilus galloprovincialis TaxID=29158 RepID=A0A8B6FTP1_MYTGA|nr:Hypothetical predicted protein [Mytilus galloprovincialis]